MMHLDEPKVGVESCLDYEENPVITQALAGNETEMEAV